MTGTRPADLLRQLADQGAATDCELLGRFAAARDAAAFAELVRRHGPVVLTACRRGVGHHHDADDAFQAVFLVLARRAGAIRRPELLGNWLYRVAVRVARNARRAAARRRIREVQAVDSPEPVAPAAVPDDLGPVLDEELGRLPAWYRDAVVLCDLRGLSRADAASALGIPLGTLASRLDGGRKRLAARLGRRGVTLSVAAVLSGARAAAVPDSLLTRTCGLVADWVAGGVAPAAVLRLARGGNSMRSVVLGGLVALSLAAGAVLAGVGGQSPPRPTDPSRPPAPTAVAEPDAAAQPKPEPGKGLAARLTRTVDLGLRTVSDVAWSPDGAWLAVTGTAGTPPGSPDGVGPNTLAVVAARGQKNDPPWATLPQHAWLLGFSANGRQLLTETREDGLISGAHHVQVWHIYDPQPNEPASREMRMGPSAPYPVDQPDAEYAPGVALNEVRFLIRKGGVVQVWAMDLTEGKSKRLGTVRGEFPLAQFTPDRRRVVVVSEDGAVGLYQTTGKRVWVTPPAPKPAVRSAPGLADLPVVAVARDGSRLVAVRGRGVPLVLDATTGEALPPPEGVGMVEPTGPAAVSGDGRLAALAYRPLVARPAGGETPLGGSHVRGDPQLTVWETATCTVVRTWKGRAAGVAFDPTRPVLAVLEANGAVTRLGLWDFAGPP
jgi:RNA polymerase sigma factor (sigma-70 family)